MVAFWNNDNHTLTRTCEQYTIGIDLVALPYLTVDMLPPRPRAQFPVLPLAMVVRETHVSIPCNASPVDFKALNLKFCQCVFKSV